MKIKSSLSLAVFLLVVLVAITTLVNQQTAQLKATISEEAEQPTSVLVFSQPDFETRMQFVEMDVKAACQHIPGVSQKYLAFKAIYFNEFLANACPPDLAGIIYETGTDHGRIPVDTAQILTKKVKKDLVLKIIDYYGSYELDVKKIKIGVLDPSALTNLHIKYLKDKEKYRADIKDRFNNFRKQTEKMLTLSGQIANLELIQCGLCNTKINKIFEPLKQDLIKKLTETSEQLASSFKEYLLALIKGGIAASAFEYYIKSDPGIIEEIEIKAMLSYIDPPGDLIVDTIINKSLRNIYIELDRKNPSKTPEIVSRPPEDPFDNAEDESKDYIPIIGSSYIIMCPRFLPILLFEDIERPPTFENGNELPKGDNKGDDFPPT